MSSGSCNKVNTATQVDYNCVETRSIIGQEDNGVEYLTINISDLSLKKQTKGIRPPLVGQASSSSNDSVSPSFETRTLGHDRLETSPTYSHGEPNRSNDSLEPNRTSYLPNRNDYINQLPPEGSYCHIYTPSQPTESNNDLIRVRSSSSASSVTSSRPLEWDYGADVGYNKCHAISGKILDSNMSTVERMALVSSTKLLGRSEPEGTTAGTFHKVKNTIKTKMRVKNQFGHPNAESTPLGTHVASDESPDTVDFISPIPYRRTENSELEIISSESDSHSNKNHKPKPDDNLNTQRATSEGSEISRQKIPLFPEISLGNCLSNELHKGRQGSDESESSNFQHNGRKFVSSDSNINEKPEQCIRSHLNQFSHELREKLVSVDGKDIVHKKMSSSLENISSLNDNAPTNGKPISSTLPRRHSQTDLYLDNLPQENITEGKVLKGNILIQNLLKNKSASSSSVATVVHRKGDSPKHALVQTSIFKKQSVGTQVCESIERNPTTSRLFTGNVFNETPHFPKSAPTQQPMKKSNYFDIENQFNQPKKFSIDKPMGTSNNCRQNQLISTNCGSHFHNGILCRGAHKKNFGEGPPGLSNPYSTNFKNTNCYSPNTSVVIPFNNRHQHQSIIDSVESSVKSGGCGTDKQYSVVEDRVNSFEYLPGHVYENNERQQPVNSCGTSSMSIENQTSNSATPDDQNKNWESSAGGSLSTNFEKDAQRGVDILSDFLKETYNNNKVMKRKLIRRVVDKLISKNIMDKKNTSYSDLMKNTPWVPPRPPNPIERVAVEIPKSKVPCEFSSRSEKSETTNTSSECFIPKPGDGNRCFTSLLKNNSCKKYQEDISSTSNVTTENFNKIIENSPKTLRFMQNRTQKMRKNNFSKENEDSSSASKVQRTKNWKEPATKTEKLIEERRKMQSDSSGNHSSVSQLLDMERENQLFWIRSEIEHLSNLKLLLERQEELKRGLKKYKSRQSRSSERNVLKEKNRVERDKTLAATSTNSDGVSGKSALKTKDGHPPRLKDWFENSTSVVQSHDAETDGWASHHYENNENQIKSCMKRKSKLQTHQSRTRPVNKDCALYDEPLSYFQRKKPDSRQRKQLNITDEQGKISLTEEPEGDRRNEIDKMGLPTQDERQRQRGSGCQCLCKVKCECCTNHITNSDNKKKEPLGYYILFDYPNKRNKSDKGTKQVEEMGITRPFRERQSREPLRARADNVRENTGLGGKGNGRMSELIGRESESSSNESENYRNKINVDHENPIFKGGAGELQYHLLHNRPSYVSRAEDRRKCIAQMQYLREMSSQNKRQLLSLSQPVPPPPPSLKIQRVFSQQKMRQMTEKKYRQLSEVRKKLQDTKKKESYRTNRLMAEIFKKNLQKRVLKGETNLSNSVCVISSL